MNPVSTCCLYCFDLHPGQQSLDHACWTRTGLTPPCKSHLAVNARKLVGTQRQRQRVQGHTCSPSLAKSADKILGETIILCLSNLSTRAPLPLARTARECRPAENVALRACLIGAPARRLVLLVLAVCIAVNDDMVTGCARRCQPSAFACRSLAGNRMLLDIGPLPKPLLP